MKRLTLILSIMIALVGMNANAAIYIVGDGPLGGWTYNGGNEMADQGDGLYTYNMTIAEDATSSTVYFVFADGRGADWSEFNNTMRIGPTSGNQEVTAAIWVTTQKAGGDNGAYYFKGTKGETYTVTFDANESKFRIESSTVRGDVDGDKAVSIADVTSLIDYLLSGQTAPASADCDLDGSVSISDVTCLIDYLLSGNWPEPVIENVYTVAGSNTALFGTSWDPTNTENDMVLVGDLYTWSKDNVELPSGSFAFKVTVNHDWGEAYPASDYIQPVSVKGIYNVMITFNAETKDVVCNLTLVEELPDTDVHTYTVAGSSIALFGTEWDAANEDNNMTLVDGLYTFTRNNVELTAGIIGFKVVKDHNWDIAYPSENYQGNIEANGTYDVKITFNAETEEITFTATPVEVIEDFYTVAGEPAAIFGEEWNPSYAANNMVLGENGLYTWTKKNVELTNGEEIWFKVVKNANWNTCWPAENYGYICDADGTYDLTITFNPETSEVTFSATMSEEPITEMEYTVVGPASVFGTSWDPTNENNNMVLGENGVYTWSKTGVALYGNFEFKVVGNHDYSIYEWPMGPYNWVANVAEEGVYDIVITFDPEADDADRITCTLTKTGDVAPVEHTYTVAGIPVALLGTEWDEANTDNDMTLVDGLYTFTRNNVVLTAGIISFKIVCDHDWDVAYPTENFIYNIDANGTYNVTITFNEETKEIQVTATLIEVSDDFYTVAGEPAAIFGEVWNPSYAANNMVLGENGVYTWTKKNVELTNGYAIWFKVVKNANWNTCWPAGDNFNYTCDADGTYDLTITFNPNADDENKISVTSNRVSE